MELAWLDLEIWGTNDVFHSSTLFYFIFFIFWRKDVYKFTLCLTDLF